MSLSNDNEDVVFEDTKESQHEDTTEISSNSHRQISLRGSFPSSTRKAQASLGAPQHRIGFKSNVSITLSRPVVKKSKANSPHLRLSSSVPIDMSKEIPTVMDLTLGLHSVKLENHV